MSTGCGDGGRGVGTQLRRGSSPAGGGDAEAELAGHTLSIAEGVHELQVCAPLAGEDAEEEQFRARTAPPHGFDSDAHGAIGGVKRTDHRGTHDGLLDRDVDSAAAIGSGAPRQVNVVGTARQHPEHAAGLLLAAQALRDVHDAERLRVQHCGERQHALLGAHFPHAQRRVQRLVKPPHPDGDVLRCAPQDVPAREEVRRESAGERLEPRLRKAVQVCSRPRVETDRVEQEPWWPLRQVRRPQR